MVNYKTGCFIPHRIHILKIQDQFMTDIIDGVKTFELRYNDRDYKAGDFIHFVKVNGEEFAMTDNLYVITYVLKDVPEYGLRTNYCILSIRRSNIYKFLKEVPNEERDDL